MPQVTLRKMVRLGSKLSLVSTPRWGSWPRPINWVRTFLLLSVYGTLPDEIMSLFHSFLNISIWRIYTLVRPLCSAFNCWYRSWATKDMQYKANVTVMSLRMGTVAVEKGHVLTSYSLPVTWYTSSLTFNNCTLCPHCIYVFCVYLRTNSDLCHLQHKLTGFYNRDEKCLQRGTGWVFK